MTTWILKRNHLLAGVLLLQYVFLSFSAAGLNQFQMLNIVGFLCLIFIPGFLTVLGLRLKGLSFPLYLTMVVGLSVFELMTMGLISNALLPYLGMAHPLGPKALLLQVPILINILLVFAYERNEDIAIPVRPYVIFNTLKEAVIACVPLVFILLSILGAIRLNNGADGTLTLIMLAGMGVYFLYLLYIAEDTSDNVIPTALYFISLALLFMTSLRGWHITGHDIQWEYKVFELTKQNGLWDMAAYRDAYNACLSITVLPTIFANLLSLSDQYIFKVLFQIIFALVPMGVYLLSRNWFSKRIAMLGVIYFVAFPTFFSDMPFLVRQEIAFLFYSLMLALIFENSLSWGMRKVLFIVMGFGVILSHYSTTYTILFIFGASAFLMPTLSKIFASKRPFIGVQDGALTPLMSETGTRKIRVTILSVLLLFAVSFVWTSLITKTSSNVSEVLKQTVVSIRAGFGDGSRSTDATSLFTSKKPSASEVLSTYIDKVALPTRKAHPGSYIATSTIEANPLQPATESKLPLTYVGRLLENAHIDPMLISTKIGTVLGRLVEVLVLLGMLAVLIRKKARGEIDLEFYTLAGCSLLFVIAAVVVPVLSVEYGVFRALQQSLIVVAPFIALSSALFPEFISSYAERLSLRVPSVARLLVALLKSAPALLAVAFFLYSTGFMGTFVGRAQAQMHLSNAGPYYDFYYTHAQDLAAIFWISDVYMQYHVEGRENFFELQADRNSQNKIVANSPVPYSQGIFPYVVKLDSFVYLEEMATQSGRATVSYQGDAVTYEYPIALINSKKNLVYSNGSVNIYR